MRGREKEVRGGVGIREKISAEVGKYGIKPRIDGMVS